MADTFVCALQIAYGHIFKARIYKNSKLHRDKIAENTHTHWQIDSAVTRFSFLTLAFQAGRSALNGNADCFI